MLRKTGLFPGLPVGLLPQPDPPWSQRATPLGSASQFLE
jgi:hypothetical protein